jgi:hypothetical protein
MPLKDAHADVWGERFRSVHFTFHFAIVQFGIT